MRNLIPSFIATLLMSIASAIGDEPLVFISAFAPGEKSAIHSFQFDLTTGALKPLHRTTEIKSPFFLAISPDKRFLYATNAEKFGGGDESVVAFAIEDRTGHLKRLNQESTRG